MENVNCNLCGSSEFQVLYPSTIDASDTARIRFECTNDGHGQYYQIVRCSECGLVYCYPRMSEQEMKQQYENVCDENYKEEAAGRVKTFQKNLKNIFKFKDKGDLLDVGCAMGVFLNEARDQGWKVQGIEPSKWCVAQAQEKYSLNISQGTFQDMKQLNRKFDVVTMWDVLEHVSDPMLALKSCREALKEDGLLVFSTVDIGSLYARMLGKKWPWLMAMHIYYFDKKTIRKYLDKCGLVPIQIKTYKHIVSLKYLLYKLNKINKFLFYLGKGLQFFCPRKRDVFVQVGLGDFMVVYAKKK